MKLREARERAGLTVTEAAKKMHLSELAIERWEEGRAVPRDKTKALIFEAYGVSNKDIEWPEAKKTAMQTALQSGGFLRETIMSFTCPEELGGKFKNYCDGTPGQPRRCRECWNQEAKR